MNQNKTYEAPQVEIMSLVSEQNVFTLSGGLTFKNEDYDLENPDNYGW